MEWNLICRICLQDGLMTSIYEDFNESEAKIFDIIMKCCPIEIQEDQDMPEQICQKCYSDLKVAYRFRTNGESSHAILLSLLNKSQVPDTEYEYSIEEIVKEEPDDEEEAEEEEEVDADDSVLVDYDEEEQEVLVEKPDNVLLDDLLEDPLPDDVRIFEAAKKAAWGDEADAQQEEIDNLEKGILVQGYKPVRQVESVKRRMAEEAKGHVLTADGRHTIEKVSKKVSSEGAKAIIAIRPVPKPKPPKRCEICGNTYKYQHALDGHMRRHRNEKPYACDVCGRAFVIPFELRRHMRIHTGVKPYACKYCDRRFSDFGSRIKHERTHTGERPYACTYCGKSFAYSHVLSSHVMIHTGEKRYQCEVCDKKFTKSHHLKAHMNIHLRAQGKEPATKPKARKTPAKVETLAAESVTEDAQFFQNVVYMKDGEEGTIVEQTAEEAEEAQQILIIQEN
ncbi:transcription factor Ouib-like [Phlebotomus argentipes]|uniref:transcription factor Ouib-like n=1 Tax=Phlebotomus argentipes TaxID=94469 RepID=UPI0028930FED|nr:transcription factor Ouib-like [Phlebotomus argentipes]